MKRRQKKGRRKSKVGLEVYAFWTGFASTIISLVQVLILASR